MTAPLTPPAPSKAEVDAMAERLRGAWRGNMLRPDERAAAASMLSSLAERIAAVEGLCVEAERYVGVPGTRTVSTADLRAALNPPWPLAQPGNEGTG